MNTPVNFVDTNALFNLGNTPMIDLVNQFGAGITTNDAGVATAIEQARAEAKKRSDEYLAEQVIALDKTRMDFLMAQAAAHKRLQDELTAVTATMAAVDRATKYGSETGRYLPLAALLGNPMPAGASKEDRMVPKDWVPAAAPAAAA